MSTAALIREAVNEGALRPLDYHLAHLLAGEEQPLLMWLTALVSAESAQGHVCLPLETLRGQSLWAWRQGELEQRIWQSLGNPDEAACLQALKHTPVVSDGSQPTPLVLYNQSLYLQRLWQDEKTVADFFLQRCQQAPAEPETLQSVLNSLFPTAQVSHPTEDSPCDWQKVAAAVALTRSVSVISGGPGTGKTTTVARLLAAQIRLASGKALRIRMAAPTGKAAARLTESLRLVLPNLPITEKEKAYFPTEAVTLHRLLGVQANTVQFRYHAGNPLHLDMLVVDEASMVDLSMMARLVSALPAHAHLILLGDREQLASVEAGAVLGDLCWFARWGFSAERAQQLSRLTGYALSGEATATPSPLSDSLCLLRKSYRFHEKSGIGQLALAVNQGASRDALHCFSHFTDDIALYPLTQSQEYASLLQYCVSGYEPYLRLVSAGESPETVLAAFGQFQLLCALREGPFGVQGLNSQVELALYRAGLLQERPVAGRWYPGKPVIIQRNDAALGLFNGDVGIALWAQPGKLKVYFMSPEGQVRGINPSRLPEHELAYAMTVHKSQGSEFDHTLLVLPDRYAPVLTRELVYTAVTRAKQRLSLFANPAVLSRAIETPTERRSGLIRRLQWG